MKSAHNLLHWRYLLVVVLVLGSAMTGAAPVFAVTGSATSAATPSNTTPSVGGSITVAININMSGVSAPDNALGSFTGTLNWNTAVLTYNSYTGLASRFHRDGQYRQCGVWTYNLQRGQYKRRHRQSQRSEHHF